MLIVSNGPEASIVVNEILNRKDVMWIAEDPHDSVARKRYIRSHDTGLPYNCFEVNESIRFLLADKDLKQDTTVLTVCLSPILAYNVTDGPQSVVNYDTAAKVLAKVFCLIADAFFNGKSINNSISDLIDTFNNSFVYLHIEVDSPIPVDNYINIVSSGYLSQTDAKISTRYRITGAKTMEEIKNRLVETDDYALSLNDEYNNIILTLLK
ncbi:MAG: hypothetical protein KatS3mg101_0875 [Patescibacteria group bacterium]|nr:MAG: hypothetical protein KatS3mg101_0875 [Patescibacteria group bacterium]